MARILLTGATGYVGGRLVPLLLEGGHDVRTTTSDPEREMPWWADRVGPEGGQAGAPVLRGAADMYVGMSALHYEHNDLEAATQCLLTSQSLGELAGLPQNPYRWRVAMALPVSAATKAPSARRCGRRWTPPTSGIPTPSTGSPPRRRRWCW